MRAYVRGRDYSLRSKSNYLRAKSNYLRGRKNYLRAAQHNSPFLSTTLARASSRAYTTRHSYLFLHILHPQCFDIQTERSSGEGLKDKNHTYSEEYACARSRHLKESSQGLARC